MLKKSITYKDFNDTERTEEFRFNLSKSEITDMELSVEGGLSVKLQAIVNANSTPEIVKLFKEFILNSYGILADDGRSFLKIDPVTGEKYAARFAQTKAFEELYMEMLSNPDMAAAFINGIMPKEIVEEANRIQKEQAKAKLSVVDNTEE